MKRSFGTMDEESVAGMENFPSVVCCVCAAPMPPNDSAMCSDCLRSDVDITSGFSRHLVMPHCRGCNRYNSPPWVKAELESRELLQVCLKKIKGLKKQAKLVDANFLYTEPHSKRLKVKLTIQKEIGNGAIVQHEFVVQFVVQNHQCEDCKRNYTPHIWVALVQVRQRVTHRRTLYFLEQLLIKHEAMKKILFVKQSPEGFDFFFASKSHGNTFSHFIQNHFPCTHKDSRQLVTHDAKNNTYKYKYTALVDICPVCKDDLVYFPPKLRAMHGGIGSLVLCNKVSTALSMVDPVTLQGADVARVKYYEYPFYAVCTRRHLTEFVVINVEDERITGKKITPEKHLGSRKRYKLCHVELARLADFGVNEERIITKSHLGSYHLHAGDHVLGYDLRTINASGIDDKVIEQYSAATPIIIIRKKYLTSQKRRIERRKWKLERLQVENDDGMMKVKEAVRDERDFNDFQDDLEEDPELRRNVNLYRDPARLRSAEEEEEEESKKDEDEDEMSEDDLPEIPLAELLEALTLNDGGEDEEDKGMEDEDNDDL
eukprot:GEMP01035826.1.p1 GENE.GEMP01035826.1~~GEMP01035826.1.p1  ORF type:complete len:544 (+),score=109.74 GEMP01035826.1:37-1668(+)